MHIHVRILVYVHQQGTFSPLIAKEIAESIVEAVQVCHIRLDYKHIIYY